MGTAAVVGHRAPAPSIYAGILLCSVAVLMQEILLTRIFSLTIWYHFAYLAISTALLGFGAAGSLLAARPQLLGRGADRRAAIWAGSAGLSLLIALWILAPRPIDPNKLLSEPLSTFAGLLGYYALVAIPFFLAGLAVVAPLAAHPERANRLYAADLLGAGLGCSAAVAALTWMDGAASVAVCAGIFLAAASCYTPVPREKLAAGILSAALMLGSPFAERVVHFLPSESKVLGAALRDPKTEVLFTQWSAVNRVDVFRPALQFGGWWGGFGVSDAFEGRRPKVLEIQYDGHNGTSVYQAQDAKLLRFLDHHILRTPYELIEHPRVLIIGVGGGVDVLNAVRRGAKKVVGVDLQPITIDLHHGLLAEWTGGVMQRPEVELVAAEGRNYVRSQDAKWDIIQLTAVDTFSAQTTGAYVLAESYLYTLEAMEDYLGHLSEDGLVSMVIGDGAYHDERLPTPLSSRLALTALRALERNGVESPREHILVLAKFEPLKPGSWHDPEATRGIYPQNLIVKKKPFTKGELQRVRKFAASNGFLLLAEPGSKATPLARLLTAPIERLPDLLADQPFVLDPVTDDDPFFFSVLPWSSLITGERIVWQFPGSTTGQLMLVMMLTQALLLGALLILLPLSRVKREQLPRKDSIRYLLYFLGLGVGFLLVEISFVQKYVLVLGYPTYSLSVTIFSLLVFAALGANLSRRFFDRPRRFLRVLLLSTVGLIVAEVLMMPWIRDALLGTSLAVRIAFTMLLQLPLGVVLGMFFPTGLEIVRKVDPTFVPWAWAINGVGSVIATVLAVILGMEIGFAGVALVAAGIYAIGTLAMLSALKETSGS